MQNREQNLHVAVCSAVQLMNQSLLESPELQQAHVVLRQALVDHADVVRADTLSQPNDSVPLFAVAHADGRYCTHHDDDPAHTKECYEMPTASYVKRLENAFLMAYDLAGMTTHPLPEALPESMYAPSYMDKVRELQAVAAIISKHLSRGEQ
jgi:hypothetical protein